MADYFNMLATKVQESKKLAAVPVCDLSKAQQPVGMSYPPHAHYSPPD